MELLLTAFLLVGSFFCFSQPVFAHINSTDHNSFFSGFFHPFNGVDHVLVMMMVGIWASQLGKKALWIVPGTFVVAMGMGFVLTYAGIRFSFTESAILSSIFMIGLITAMALRLPTWLSVVIIAVFALFHGHIHEREPAEAIPYVLGFILATILLHIAGMILAIGTHLVTGQENSNKTRTGGALAVLAGLYLFLVT